MSKSRVIYGKSKNIKLVESDGRIHVTVIEGSKEATAVITAGQFSTISSHVDKAAEKLWFDPVTAKSKTRKKK